ncbi:hypothetical protein [Nocardia sp. NBC_01327]|uniref:hypothetical protein n=1 Tax=Nocardia sp. NBC_01327 TaxID=2903593 RepID=UPI002E13B861|nr:hypothetical protein OG326_34315 [Nocardia sp. NBC_01327]
MRHRNSVACRILTICDRQSPDALEIFKIVILLSKKTVRAFLPSGGSWTIAFRLLSGSIAESSPADECRGEVEESVVNVGATFPSDGQPPVLVQ